MRFHSRLGSREDNVFTAFTLLSKNSKDQKQKDDSVPNRLEICPRANIIVAWTMFTQFHQYLVKQQHTSYSQIQRQLV